MAEREQYVDGKVSWFKPWEIYLEVGQHAALKAQAAAEGIPMAALVRRAIDLALFLRSHYVAQIVLSDEEQAKLRGLAARLNVSNPDAAAEKLLREAIETAYASITGGGDDKPVGFFAYTITSGGGTGGE